MNSIDYLTIAIKETELLRAEDKVFLVKDLFKGYEWNRISIAERLKLGTLFLYKVQSDKSLKIRALDKTSSNQQKYEKIK